MCIIIYQTNFQTRPFFKKRFPNKANERKHIVLKSVKTHAIKKILLHKFEFQF